MCPSLGVVPALLLSFAATFEAHGKKERWVTPDGVEVVADSAVVGERRAQTGGHQARFTITNHGRTTDTFHVGCVGLARVRCTGTSVSELTLRPGASAVVEASYTVHEAGRGQVRVTVFSPGTGARGSGVSVVPVRQ